MRTFKSIKLNKEVCDAVRTICFEYPLTEVEIARVLMGLRVEFNFEPHGIKEIHFAVAISSDGEGNRTAMFDLEDLENLKNLCEAILNQSPNYGADMRGEE